MQMGRVDLPVAVAVMAVADEDGANLTPRPYPVTCLRLAYSEPSSGWDGGTRRYVIREEGARRRYWWSG